MRLALILLLLCLASASSANAPQPRAAAERAESTNQITNAAPRGGPVPVRVVNQPSEPGGYQDPCQYNESDSRSDLCAQWTAARAASDAAGYAWLQLWGAAVGIMGLLWTIWLTRRAVKAAQASVDVAQDTAKRQLRAYVIPSAFKIRKVRVGAVAEITLELKNTGQTPAYELRALAQAFIAEGGCASQFKARFTSGSDVNTSRGIIGAGGWMRFRVEFNVPVSQELMDKIQSGELELGVFGVASYRDAFNRRRLITFKRYLWHPHVPAKGVAPMVVCSKGNSAN
jgi:hypothetical protein